MPKDRKLNKYVKKLSIPIKKNKIRLKVMKSDNNGF